MTEITKETIEAAQKPIHDAGYGWVDHKTMRAALAAALSLNAGSPAPKATVDCRMWPGCGCAASCIYPYADGRTKRAPASPAPRGESGGPNWQRIELITQVITEACRKHIIRLSDDDAAILARAVDDGALSLPQPGEGVRELFWQAQKIIEQFAAKNPKWLDALGFQQDPFGAHKWLEDCATLLSPSPQSTGERAGGWQAYEIEKQIEAVTAAGTTLRMPNGELRTYFAGYNLTEVAKHLAHVFGYALPAPPLPDSRAGG